MELRHLRYFIAVGEELNFTRAAERLHTSQPSLSEQIRNLEFEVGFPLLSRSRRQVALTDAGCVFLDEARLVIRQTDEALRRARAVASRAADTYTIGFIPAAEVLIFSATLTELRMTFPKVDIVLRSLTSSEQERALADGEIDVAFMRSPIVGQNLHAEEVVTEPMRVFLPTDHRLAASCAILPEQLDNLPLICAEREYAEVLYDVTIRYLSRMKVKPSKMQEASNILTSLNLVAGGLGYALMPSYAETFTPKGVVWRPLAGNGLSIALMMVVPHGGGAKTDITRKLQELVLKSCHG